MFIDDIIDYGAGKFVDRKEWSRKAQLLIASQPFSVDPGLMEVADAIAHADAKAAATLAPAARSPFDNVWIEFRHDDRPLFLSEDDSSPVRISRPDRIGFHVVPEWGEGQEGRRMVDLYWSFPGEKRWHTSILSAVLLRDDEVEAATAETAAVKASGAATYGSIKPDRPGPWRGVSAAIGSRMRLRHNDLFHAAMEWSRRERPETYKEDMDRAVAYDWGGESRFLVLLLALLSSGTVVEADPVEHAPEIQRKRRRFGKRPLMSYSVCRIRPAIARDVVPRVEGERGVELRFHFVRGHFKRRNGRIFWWRMHERGNREIGMVDKEYLTSTPADAVPRLLSDADAG